ncbi:monovalent cation/H+ antiporter subunit D [Nitrosovibrio sp. Nv17]|jgi:multicomponent K+:H+ antiporter subunit D|uniref:monovalent cation/H+ antiporter subunit D n=1 Tax=Nitrosovibrio sp. Nv17 TaxID=1855339 RepID=UPI000908F577|nr:monovalent cation/H+ antiporter subunit D [Nitrosovibrio sp. Nv17]SFW13896.1 multisubunit potassium/proton antiporter, PhaD subunit [Nitrosovibrio sp. Nv17]
MTDWLPHLPVLPVVIPLVAGAAMLLLAEARRAERTVMALAATLANLVVAVMLVRMAGGALPGLWPDGVAAYRLGGWQPPFGIVMVADALSAALLLLNAVLALAALAYALARWKRMGPHFQSLFQFIVMGINGAFLAGDLFNLFVFVEVLLASSYGLALHGSGVLRIKAGLHYIVVNLAGSFVFLIGVSLIYGTSGTLNMADLALRVPRLQDGDRVLFEAGAAILGVAFLLKAGAWPLNFWLPSTYGAAAPPVAALFSIMTKVGVYALLRVGSLLGAAPLPDGGAPAPFSEPWLFGIGLATLLLGTAGMLATRQPQRLVAYCVITSAGTLLAAFGLGGAPMKSAALFYLASSVLATGAFFMLSEMVGRTRPAGAEVEEEEPLDAEAPLDPSMPDEDVGIVIPAAMAFLGMGFVACALLVTGLPPLSGFVAKFLLLSATLDIVPSAAPIETWPPAIGVLWAAVLGSSLVSVIALCKMGVRLFWNSGEIVTPRLYALEAMPVAGLLLLSVALAAGVGPAMDYLDRAGRDLSAPQIYIEAVLGKDVPTDLTDIAGGGR